MKIRNIRSGSLLVGVSVAAVALAAMLITPTSWKISVPAAIFIAGTAYAISALVMRKFVIHKLKPMYQIMLKRNIRTKELEREMAGRSDLVSAIEEDIKNWAETSRQEIARLKENEKYRKEYIGNVSHEMKTPIFNIQGYISTLLDGGLEDDTINRKYLERAERSIDRMINIVTDLDEISKLESGVLTLHKETFDVVALARETAEAVEMDAARKNIRIIMTGQREGAPLPPMLVYADKHYVSQIFINLLTNSIRYGNENGRTVVTFVDIYEKIMVEVTDNGVGIAQDDIPRVFERFYRTDKSRSREEGGTGLGLSIVKHIIEAHQEQITLRSELGRGSTFSFTLGKA